VEYYHKFANVCFKVLRVFALISIVLMLGLMTVEVVRRYIFSVNWIWSDEIIRLLLVYCAYFGGAAAYYQHRMICFTLLTDNISQGIKDKLNLGINIILTGYLGFLLYLTYYKMNSSSAVKSISTASGLSGAVPYYGMFAGLIFLLIFTIDFYPDLIRRVMSKQDDVKEPHNGNGSISVCYFDGMRSAYCLCARFDRHCSHD
jgi:TRAP-type C4-dicarboxylate transport system permease small subunit